MRLLPPAVLAAVALAAPAAAHAATPTSGAVREGSLVQRWTGEAYGQPFNNFRQTQRAELCLAPFCDTFTLEVEDAGALSLRITAPASAGFVAVETTLPDGTIDYDGGASGETINERRFDEAKVGTYTVRVWGNFLYGLTDGQYSGRATLVLPVEE